MSHHFIIDKDLLTIFLLECLLFMKEAFYSISFILDPGYNYYIKKFEVFFFDPINLVTIKYKYTGEKMKNYRSTFFMAILILSTHARASEFCQVTTPSQIKKEQELRVGLSSSGVVRIQASVNGGDFGDFSMINGIQTYAGNSFDPGTYKILFRARKANGEVVPCNPTHTYIMVTGTQSQPPSPVIPTVPTPPTNPTVPSNPANPVTPPIVQSQVFPHYLPIVAQQGLMTGFRNLQQPQNLPTMRIDGVILKVLDYEAISNLQGTIGQLKFFLPPGTMAYDANFYHYLAYQDGKGATKLYSPPTININAITPSMAFDIDNIPGGSDYSKVFNKLSGGGEVLYYTRGAPANFLVVSSPSSLGAPLTIGGYVYTNFQHPGDQFQRSLWKVYVKADCYEKWFNSPSTKWDANGNPSEGFAHSCN